MDFFGIGAAMRGMALTYFQAARRTGRTTALLSALKDGDRVFCLNAAHAALLQRQCRDRRLTVECLCIPPRNIHRIADRLRNRPISGRTFFDHTWVEQYYLDAIDHATTALIDLQKLGANADFDRKDLLFRDTEMAKWNY